MSSPQRYPVPGSRTRVEDEVKGSRFITTIARASTTEDARRLLESVREEFADATHNCWAYVIGPPGNTQNTGAGDDGEPGGTAGAPMLRVLLGSGVGDVAAVVTRYFGGTKLGRGGLVRAYSAGVQHALREMSRDEFRARVRLRIELSYSYVDTIGRLLSRLGGEVESEDFAQNARMVVRVPVDAVAGLEESLRDVTSGTARLDILSEDDGPR